MDSQAMRETLRLWASGVSVVTTAHNGELYGSTVSAFNSVSLEPPLILVCLNKDMRLAKAIRESGVFAVSMLAAEHACLSDRFAGRVQFAEGEDRFDGVAITDAETGSPILADAIGWLDCKVHALHDGGTHWIVVGAVQAAGSRSGDPEPLIYFNRGYRELVRQHELAVGD